MSHKYWVVGSMFSGSEDQLQNFLERGYWYCWDPKVSAEIPDRVTELFPQIAPGDRLAIKRMLGRGESEIEIRALGIVKAVDLTEWRIYVDWLVSDLSKRVPCKNYLGSLHGPIPPGEWRGEAFEI